jgi:CDP-diacylglycerol--glycerol-3-phosphate 3-phosphatidyltransferase
MLFNLTDFFDGYLARKYKQETKIGRLLDPIADKFLLFSVLIALVAASKIFFYWAIIFIARDFFMMGLRIVSLEHGISLSVSYLAKIKTALLTAYVTIVIINPSPTVWRYTWMNTTELALLVLSLILSLWTAVEYLQLFAKHYSGMEES